MTQKHTRYYIYMFWKSGEQVGEHLDIKINISYSVPC